MYEFELTGISIVFSPVIGYLQPLCILLISTFSWVSTFIYLAIPGLHVLCSHGSCTGCYPVYIRCFMPKIFQLDYDFLTLIFAVQKAWYFCCARVVSDVYSKQYHSQFCSMSFHHMSLCADYFYHPDGLLKECKFLGKIRIFRKWHITIPVMKLYFGFIG